MKRDINVGKGNYEYGERIRGGTSGGIGFSGVLTITFIILKLCGVIEWSWVWILAPLWFPVALIAAFFVVMLIIAGIIGLITWIRGEY